MGLSEFAELLPSSQRRKLRRGFTDSEQKFLEKLEKRNDNVETHCRDMIILPSMVGKNIKIHNGKNFIQVTIMAEMIGHTFGEFAPTRSRISHSSPGVGATRSSGAISVR